MDAFLASFLGQPQAQTQSRTAGVLDLELEPTMLVSAQVPQTAAHPPWAPHNPTDLACSLDSSSLRSAAVDAMPSPMSPLARPMSAPSIPLPVSAGFAAAGDDALELGLATATVACFARGEEVSRAVFLSALNALYSHATSSMTDTIRLGSSDSATMQSLPLSLHGVDAAPSTMPSSLAAASLAVRAETPTVWHAAASPTSAASDRSVSRTLPSPPRQSATPTYHTQSRVVARRRSKSGNKNNATSTVRRSSSSGTAAASVECPVCLGRGRTGQTRACCSCYSGWFHDVEKLFNNNMLVLTGDDAVDLERAMQGIRRLRRPCSNDYRCSPDAYYHATDARLRCCRCRSLAFARLLPSIAVSVLRRRQESAITMAGMSHAGAALGTAAAAAGSPFDEGGALPAAFTELCNDIELNVGGGYSDGDLDHELFSTAPALVPRHL